MTIETFLAPTQVALMAPLVNRLAGAFEREKILYSHWKSNIHLAKGTAGDIDLDLLVDRRCLPRALSILADLGFKAAVARWGADSPGISHFYGFDEQTEALIHVHLFSIVLTGESYVKSHLLPFEAMLLENVTYLGLLRVTNKEAELVLFTLRALIKYGSFPDLLSVWNKADTLREEVRWLSDGGDLEVALSLLRRHCPPIDERLFVRCVETLEGDNSLLSRIVLARQVRRRLRVYARHGFFGRTLAYGQLLWAEAQRRARPKRKNKALKAGGALIALVGAEATGKSTLVAETGRWLGREE